MEPKTVLVTGASSGFGRATAKILAERGHRLVLIARRGDRLEALKHEWPVQIHAAAVDVSDKAQVKHFFASLPEDFKDIDILVNAAGLALGMEPAQRTDLEDWERMVDTNVKGLLYVTRPVIDNMVARGSGLIVNIGSVSSFLPYKGSNVYGGTKAFVRQFSRNLRLDLFGTGVKVSNIEPGAAETEFSVVRFKDEQIAKDYYKGWRALKPKDVAAAIVWVIDQPDHVNIDNIEIMPLDQTAAGAAINRP